MAAIEPCVPCCSSTPQTVNVPGTAGASAITTVGSPGFNLPAVGSTVAIPVGDTSWLQVGKNVFISDGAKQANFIVTAIGGPTAFTGRFLAFPGDSASGAISAGALVMAGVGDFTVPWDLDLLTSFVDNSGGTKSDTIPSTLAKSTVILPAQLTDFASATTFKIAVPYAFLVNTIGWRTAKAGTSGGAGSVSFVAKISGTNITNGTGTLALADTATPGTLKDLTAGSLSVNTGTAGATIEMAATVGVAYTGGDGYFEFGVTNTDMTAFLAAVAFKANQLRTALRHL